jgi:hypothetical protein
MLTPSIGSAVRPAPVVTLCRTACFLAALWSLALCVPTAGAQGPDAPVGRIEGDDISVRGEVHVMNENGRTYTSLTSGSQVTVRSGSARIDLAAGGGEIGICGPARFSLVRAGASLTLALDYGRVRARVADPANLRIYTPQVAASPVAAVGIADDLSVGLEESGKMCVHAASGALRLEPQFGGESIVVPQGMEAALRDGQLASLAETGRGCACDALDARRAAPAMPANAVARIPVGAGAPPATEPASPGAEKKSAEPAPSAPGEQPIWKVYMPPLTYNAGEEKSSAPAKGASLPPPSPQTALLFREVYVEPVIVWRGEVEAPAKEKPAAAAANQASAAEKSAERPAKKPSFGARVASFFRRLFGGKRKPQPQSATNELAPDAVRGSPFAPACIPS